MNRKSLTVARIVVISLGTFTPAAFAGFYGEPATVDLYVTG